jgi:adenosylhomocysteine nucleosidase
VKEEGRRKKEERRPEGETRKVLVCFALKEEARPFRRLLAEHRDIRVLLLGMGKRNAERAIRATLAEERPDLVLTCGLAGGLRPDLAMGAVVFDADPDTGLEPALLAAGAKPARFYCAERVIVTAAEKQALHQSTGADVVEMESEPVRTVCRDRRIPSATVRVIQDTAQEDLPIDFNQLLTPDQRLSYAKLAVALAKSPGKVGALLRLQKHTQAAADRLAEVLFRITAA